MLTKSTMIAGMAIIVAALFSTPVRACDNDRSPCPPLWGPDAKPQKPQRPARNQAATPDPFANSFFGQGPAVERPAQRAVRPRTRAPASAAARKPVPETPPAEAVPALAAPAAVPAPAALTPPAPAEIPSTPPAPTAFVEPVAPVLLTSPAEIARIIKQSQGTDVTSGVVWIVSPTEVNHIDLQAGRAVLSARASEDDLWSAPWFQRLLATIGGALAAASAFRLFFA